MESNLIGNGRPVFVHLMLMPINSGGIFVYVGEDYSLVTAEFLSGSSAVRPAQTQYVTDNIAPGGPGCLPFLSRLGPKGAFYLGQTDIGGSYPMYYSVATYSPYPPRFEFLTYPQLQAKYPTIALTAGPPAAIPSPAGVAPAFPPGVDPAAQIVTCGYSNDTTDGLYYICALGDNNGNNSAAYILVAKSLGPPYKVVPWVENNISGLDLKTIFSQGYPMLLTLSTNTKDYLVAPKMASASA